MSNRVGLFFGAVGSMTPLIQEGKLRALMVTDRQRSSLLPNVPSAAEAGAPAMDRKVRSGFSAPAGTPDAVVERLNKEFVTALGQQETEQRLAQLGANIKAGSSKDFAELIATDTTRLGKVVKNAGARLIDAA